MKSTCRRRSQTHWNTCIHHGAMFTDPAGDTKKCRTALPRAGHGQGPMERVEPHARRCYMSTGILSAWARMVGSGFLAHRIHKYDLVAEATLVEASSEPNEFGFRGRQLLKYPAWAAPIVAHGLLYVRGAEPAGVLGTGAGGKRQGIAPHHAIEEAIRMVDTHHFDMVVIGTGPGGEGAGMAAAKAGKRVAAVERFSQVGGGCTHWATIPSKALRQAIYHVNLCDQSAVSKRLDDQERFSLPDLLATASSVIAKQVDMHKDADRNDVALVCGSAKFIDPHTIDVDHCDHATRRPRPTPSSSPPARGPIGRRTWTSITRASSTATPSSELDDTPRHHHHLRRRRGGLRIRVDVPQPGLQGQPGQHAATSCSTSWTTRSSTRSATTCASGA